MAPPPYRHTHNIDQLARKGIRFTQFYNVARCCPTRASLLTGLYPHQAGMGWMEKYADYYPKGMEDPLENEEGLRCSGSYQGYINTKYVTIAGVLKQAGYHTLMSGKWHLGRNWLYCPIRRGFDRYWWLIDGADNNFEPNNRMAAGNQIYFPPEDTTFYMTDAISDNPVKYIEAYSKRESPFFLYIAYTASHWPLHVYEEDIARYKDKFRKGWDKLREERYRRMLKLGIIEESCSLTPRDKQIKPWEDVTEKRKKEMIREMAVYAAQIDRMDQGIGKVVHKVREAGIEKNTLIMFLPDNGGYAEGGPWGWRRGDAPIGDKDCFSSYGRSWASASNTPFRLYKHWVHEGGISTPFIAYWPALIDSGIIDQVGHVIDIMATCIDVAGADYPKKYRGNKITPLEGKSLLPIFRGEKRKGDQYLFWEHEGNRTVRYGKWKLVSKFPEKWELYNLKIDRSETNNLCQTYPELVKELKEKYNEWADGVWIKKRKK